MEQSLTQRQEEWAKRVARWRASQLGRDEFAAQEGVTGKRLVWWSWKLRKLGVVATAEPMSAVPAPSFVRLEAVPTAPTTPSGVEGVEPLELVLSRSRRLLIPVGFDGGTLSRVMALLEGGGA